MSAPSSTCPIGIIGGGLMGREIASAFARWCALTEPGLPTPVLRGVADLNAGALEWFGRIPTCTLRTTDYHELLASDAIEVVYVAVPHHLHEEIYLAVLEAGKDLMAEKPFGIDLDAARHIAAAAKASGRFVRVSSEFPFYPGAQEVMAAAADGKLGRPLEVRAGFHHASDLDPDKPANWKRQSSACGTNGVLNDLGLHPLHIPLRLGWSPRTVYAQLQKGVPERPDGKGGTAPCDTWDNAALHTWTTVAGEDVPMALTMKRLAPGATNDWRLEVLGTDGGARFSTSEPRTLYRFRRAGETPGWTRTDIGFGTVFPTITGGIFEVGFPDLIQQMWAAFLAERAGVLGGRFGCATPDELVRTHEIFEAALASHDDGRVVTL